MTKPLRVRCRAVGNGGRIQGGNGVALRVEGKAGMAGTLLQQVRVVDPATATDAIADVLMRDGTFAAIAPQLPLPTDPVAVLDGTGKVLLPGLIDLYSHSSEPGYEVRETLADLLAGAIAGGFTRLGILPDTEPALDEVGALRHLLDLAQDLPPHPQPQLLPWAALTHQVQGAAMTELATLGTLTAPAIAGFADGQPIHNPVLLHRLLEYVRPLQRPVALWPCDRTLAGDGIARAGAIALRGGLPGALVAAETAALATILELVRELGTPVHLMRLSTARSVELIAAAKAAGLPITASTLPGVVKTSVGYMGGHFANPCYLDVLSRITGHAEVAQIVYD
ncbi:MAG TPA: peptide-methionine (S)-S-oxide reductase, partial [Candidatus Obscuribacterales bacterium]